MHCVHGGMKGTATATPLAATMASSMSITVRARLLACRLVVSEEVCAPMFNRVTEIRYPSRVGKNTFYPSLCGP